ncbi:MAG: hypothetical protein WC648_05160 [Candidatus Paceibacterota bacterium]|jgi:hypothetical protein
MTQYIITYDEKLDGITGAVFQKYHIFEADVNGSDENNPYYILGHIEGQTGYNGCTRSNFRMFEAFELTIQQPEGLK